MFRRLSDWLALTSTERKVILFLSGAFVLGAGIRLFQETFPSIPDFDYAASDSTFAALSERPVDDTVAEDDTAAPVNINTASKEELMTLPGVGAVMAERILAYRAKVGSFKSCEEMRNVKGIGKRRLEQLLPLITVH
jgi:competence protein ComEA